MALLNEMNDSSKDPFWAELEYKLKQDLDNLNSSPGNYLPLLNELQTLTQLTVEDDFRYEVCLVHIEVFNVCFIYSIFK